MKLFFLTLSVLALLIAPRAAFADPKPDQGQLMVPPPMIEPVNPDGSRCFKVVNKAPYTVTGSVLTDYETNMVGQKKRNVSNFRLAPGVEKKYCTYGPYYPGTRIGVMLRTLIPVFSCYTVAQGTIEILGKFEADGKTKSWINCQ